MSNCDPFKINGNGQVVEKRYIKSIGKTYIFIACESGSNFQGSYGEYKSGYLSMAIGNVSCSSIEEARDWLFAEYSRISNGMDVARQRLTSMIKFFYLENGHFEITKGKDSLVGYAMGKKYEPANDDETKLTIDELKEIIAFLGMSKSDKLKKSRELYPEEEE